jgi:tetratricopeptide (TPR) repeat protein
MMGSPTGLLAQFGPLLNAAQAPQARSKEELDEYLEIVTQTDPTRTVERVKSFAAQYPNSELLGFAYQYQARAFAQLDDLTGVLEAGHRALRANPDNLNTLLLLSSTIANHAAGRPDQASLLQEAEKYANQALAGIERAQVPRQILPEDWRKQKQTMQAQCHEVLGVVASDRGKLQTAIDEFTTAVHLNPAPQGDQFFRLGLAYASVGDKTRAREALERAAELGPPLVRKRALDELEKVSNDKSFGE